VEREWENFSHAMRFSETTWPDYIHNHPQRHILFIYQWLLHIIPKSRQSVGNFKWPLQTIQIPRKCGSKWPGS
jgi:hypothetical protein